jgi:hypothetical protein
MPSASYPCNCSDGRTASVGDKEFAATSRNAPAGNLDAFRADQDAAADHEDGDPYDR